MITVKNAIDSISERLGAFANYIALQNGANYYDSNTASERFFIPILNIVYDWNLEDLNIERSNYPAIDLSDISNRVCVQVTSVNNTTKLKNTLVTLRKYNLIKDYNRLIFLVLSTDKTGAATDPEIDIEIINLKMLMNKISTLSDKKIFSINEYIQNNLQYNYPVNNSVDLPSMPTVNDNELKIEKLINLLNIQNDPNLQKILINDLTKLLLKLKQLTVDQRNILYYLVWRSNFSVNSAGYEEEDIIYMPSLELEQDIPGSDPYAKILINKGLVSYNDEYIPYGVEYEIGVLEARFYGELEINLLSRIKRLCGNDINKLRSVLIDCNFTNL